jgi:predicted secreted protein
MQGSPHTTGGVSRLADGDGVTEESEDLRVSAGEVFEISLDALPSAGFKWWLRLSGEDDPRFQLLDQSWDDPNPSRVGGLSRQRFAIRALQPGDADLRFEYSRPWEDRPVKIRTVRVHVS